MRLHLLFFGSVLITVFPEDIFQFSFALLGLSSGDGVSNSSWAVTDCPPS